VETHADGRENGGQDRVVPSSPPAVQAAPSGSGVEHEGSTPSVEADEPIDPMVFDASKRPPLPDYHRLVAEGKMTREEVGKKARLLFNKVPSFELEYPELKKKRTVVMDGEERDIMQLELDTPDLMRAQVFYAAARRNLFQQWGLIKPREIPRDGETVYYWDEMTNPPKIEVDMDALIRAHKIAG
jgi:hypothetical protein